MYYASIANWIRCWTILNSGQPPLRRLHQLSCRDDAGRTGIIRQPEKIGYFNVASCNAALHFE